MRMTKERFEKVRIEKVVFGGQGLAHGANGPVFVWNGLPGELVNVRLTRRHKKVWDGVAQEIIEPSSERIPPVEPHFLSCSPWQVASLEAELSWKKDMARQVLSSIGGIKHEVEIVSNPDAIYGYRNKMEFCFTANEQGQLSLAFFVRGSQHRVPLDRCALAHPLITQAANRIVEWLRFQKVDRFLLKSLIVRTDGTQTIAGLFVTEELELAPPDELNLAIFYSNPQSPASRPDLLLYSSSPLELTENLMDTKLHYGLFSFFQVNVPMFSQTLQYIIDFAGSGTHLIDLFCGVGSIGLPLAKKFERVTLVESLPEAAEYAKGNAERNKLNNVNVIAQPAEQIELEEADVVTVDPPRVGLHQDTTYQLIEKHPHKIAYLSCNVSTQARDLKLLAKVYRVEKITLFNFFPRTPHLESLALLVRR
jgi:23S rRNA (uracil1939-C5)-methyltransferase